MKETTRIADPLRRGLAGPAWHGPALLEVLAGATARPTSAAWAAALARRQRSNAALVLGLPVTKPAA